LCWSVELYRVSDFWISEVGICNTVVSGSRFGPSHGAISSAGSDLEDAVSFLKTIYYL
jgi:hypothetical protein